MFDGHLIFILWSLIIGIISSRDDCSCCVDAFEGIVIPIEDGSRIFYAVFAKGLFVVRPFVSLRAGTGSDMEGRCFSCCLKFFENVEQA